MTLGDRIAKLRTEQHLSQGDLAEKLGVSRQSVSKWETGSSVPDLNKLVALSALFHLTLDALVREEEPEAEMNSEPVPAQPFEEKYAARKIAGWILVGIGLLSVVLGLALNFTLLVLGSYLLVCGIICHAVKKHPGLVIGWGTFLPCAYFLPWFTSSNMKMVFHPYSYQGGLTVQLIVSYAFWAILFLLMWITAKNTSVKKHPFLFCGWIIFSQAYGFIPLLFRGAKEVDRAYRAISGGTVLLLAVLVFFTAKGLYAAFRVDKN